jgi:uncharacterized membrane protein
MDLAKTYAKLRGSAGFLIGLVAFITVWLVGSKILGMDKDHGMINLILSAEASISLAFFAMLQEKTDARVQDQMEVIHNLLANMKETVEDIHEEVEDGH